MKQAAFAVVVDGTDISTALNPILISLNVSDKAGTTSDTASIELDDIAGQIVIPRPGALMLISLGFSDSGIGPVFRGKVDEVRSRGDRGSGRVLSISAKGIDTMGKAKERQSRHFDRMSIERIMQKAGEAAGISDVRVDQSFASIVREYECMDGESFLELGERIAGEIGATFKVSADRAILARRNGGTNPAGAALPTVTAAAGQNLHSWDIAPFLGRPRYREARQRYYDAKEATWKEVLTQIPLEDAEAVTMPRFPSPGEDEAKQKTESDKTESERGSGEGSVVIEGNIGAQPEGLCVLIGARDGIDGTYRIDGVDHDYSRGGFTTTLSLKQPQGIAGKDSRG
jgi:phage protein D